MGIHLVTAKYPNLVQGPARSLAPSAPTGLLLADRDADRHLGGPDFDRLISIGATFYHRVAVPAVVRRRILEPQDAPPSDGGPIL